MDSIKQIRKCKKEAEKKICDILKRFEEETGIQISGDIEIEYKRNLRIPTIPIVEVRLYVKL